MKLKELKENVVVDIKSEKQCHVLMNLLENAGYPTFTQRFSYPSGYFLKVVEIYPEDKNYIALYGGKPPQNSVSLEDVVELEIGDFSNCDGNMVRVVDIDGDGKPIYKCRFRDKSKWFALPCFVLSTFIKFYAGKCDYIEPVNDLVKIDNEIIKDSIVYYGKEAQATVCMEECAELIHAISNEKRGKSDKNHLAEEMADVLISIELLKEIYDVSNEQINEWIDKKQKRIRSRMK
jgi:NTP pyrophosphatase (non-canonical NTP hydrolase)|nr:MAG TPA: nucleoside triphosphate pyrophosphohydrolase [Caudoviricetes sp.]